MQIGKSDKLVTNFIVGHCGNFDRLVMNVLREKKKNNAKKKWTKLSPLQLLLQRIQFLRKELILI